MNYDEIYNSAPYKGIRSVRDPLPKQKFDKMLITGEVFRAWTREDHLKAKDKSFQVIIKLDKESYLALKKHRADSVDQNGNIISENDRVIPGLKAYKVPRAILDDDGEPVVENGETQYEVDDEGEIVKDLKHYQITLKQNRKNKEGKTWYLKVVDAVTGEAIDDWMGEGTKVTVEAGMFESAYEGDKFAGLNINEIKVHSLEKFEPTGGGDIWDMIGMSASSTEAPEGFGGASKGSDGNTPEPAPKAAEDDVPFDMD